MILLIGDSHIQNLELSYENKKMCLSAGSAKGLNNINSISGYRNLIIKELENKYDFLLLQFGNVDIDFCYIDKLLQNPDLKYEDFNNNVIENYMKFILEISECKKCTILSINLPVLDDVHIKNHLYQFRINRIANLKFSGILESDIVPNIEERTIICQNFNKKLEEYIKKLQNPKINFLDVSSFTYDDNLKRIKNEYFSKTDHHDYIKSPIISNIINDYLSNIQFKTIENYPHSVGNMLISYFYRLGLCIYNNENFIDNLKILRKSIFREIPDVIEYVNYINLLDNINIEKVICGNPSPESSWLTTNNDKYKFWKQMKPIVNQILNDVLVKNNLVKNIKYPVIHFRCSDVPYIKHPCYHFQRYSFFIDSLNELKYKGINVEKVNLMYSFEHNGINKEESKKYLYSLINCLEENGFKIIIIDTQSNLDDFAILFNAPAVISTCSSFSFVSGFFGNGIFITEEHFRERILNSTCDAKEFKKGYTLKHSDVIDYKDTEKVISQLEEIKIDVVFVTHEKDIRTLDLAIEGIKTNGKNINKVFVVSEKKLTDLAEWIDERIFPFTKNDICKQIFKNDIKSSLYLNSERNRIGWIYQQLLKNYSIYVIPNISNNVLVIDSDTIF